MRTWCLSHSFTVDAAHRLDHLPDGHPCRKTHGHTWNIEVGISTSMLNKDGFVVDFHSVKAICKEHVHDVLDHGCMNDILPFAPTCENLSEWVFRTLQSYYTDVELVFVTVTETEGNSVTYNE